MSLSSDVNLSSDTISNTFVQVLRFLKICLDCHFSDLWNYYDCQSYHLTFFFTFLLFFDNYRLVDTVLHATANFHNKIKSCLSVTSVQFFSTCLRFLWNKACFYDTNILLLFMRNFRIQHLRQLVYFSGMNCSLCLQYARYFQIWFLFFISSFIYTALLWMVKRYFKLFLLCSTKVYSVKANFEKEWFESINECSKVQMKANN